VPQEKFQMVTLFVDIIKGSIKLEKVKVSAIVPAFADHGDDYTLKRVEISEPDFLPEGSSFSEDGSILIMPKDFIKKESDRDDVEPKERDSS